MNACDDCRKLTSGDCGKHGSVVTVGPGYDLTVGNPCSVCGQQPPYHDQRFHTLADRVAELEGMLIKGVFRITMATDHEEAES